MAKRLPSSHVESKMCPICQHPERYQIEQLVLSVSPSNPALTLDTIADAYGVSPQELRVHALMHTPLALDFTDDADASVVDTFRQKAGVISELGGEAVGDSSRQSAATEASIQNTHDRLVDKLNLRESDMLIASANELLTTLSVLGKRIKRYAGDGSDQSDQRFVNFCSNAVVSLYTGTAGELRKTIDAIKDLNIAVNGAHDNAADGLTALAKAIRGSEEQGN